MTSVFALLSPLLISDSFSTVCDEWLPITGSLDSLDDLQRLRNTFDQTMLRVFEGLSHAGQAGRPAYGNQRQYNPPPTRWDGQEHESDDDDDDEENNNNQQQSKKRRIRNAPLDANELNEVHRLTSAITAILDEYAAERDPTMSRAVTRPSSPRMSTRPGTPRDRTRPSSPRALTRPSSPSHGGYGLKNGGGGGGGGYNGNGNGGAGGGYGAAVPAPIPAPNDSTSWW